MINYELKLLKEYHTSVSLPSGVERNISVNWNFGFSISLRPDNLIEVIVTAEVVSLQQNKPENLVELIVGHFFQVNPDELDQLLQHDKKIAFNFLATLLGISLGTVRGLAFARSSSILGHQVYMPVINPSEMLKNHLEKNKIDLRELVVQFES